MSAEVGSVAKKAFNTNKVPTPLSRHFLDGRHSLCDERGGDRVFYQHWEGNHLAELNSSGVCGPPERRVHREAPGRPRNPLQELTLGGRGCGRGRRKSEADQMVGRKSRGRKKKKARTVRGVCQAACCKQEARIPHIHENTTCASLQSLHGKQKFWSS